MEKSYFDKNVEVDDKIVFQKRNIIFDQPFEIVFFKNLKNKNGKLLLKTINQYKVESKYPITCKPGSKLSDDYCYKPQYSYSLNEENIFLNNLTCE